MLSYITILHNNQHRHPFFYIKRQIPLLYYESVEIRMKVNELVRNILLNYLHLQAHKKIYVCNIHNIAFEEKISFLIERKISFIIYMQHFCFNEGK